MRAPALLLPLLAALHAYAPTALGRELGEPPRGAPEDQLLWRAIRDVAGEAEMAMARVGQCAYRIRYGRYREELDAAAAAGAGEKAEEARKLRRGLDRAAEEAQSAIPEDGGRVRDCRYTLLHLEQRMDEPGDAPLARELPELRIEGRRCVERLERLVSTVRPVADALEAKLGEIDLFLGRLAGEARGGRPR